MQEYLKKIPEDLKDLLYLAKDVAGQKRFKIYLVGGFVRDLILGVRNFDLDIVVEGRGIEFAEELSTQLKCKLTSHRRFGTATLVLSHGLKVDVATAREECYPEPACLPSVKSGSIKDDLKRRDFSINAMSISLNPEDFGKLIDFFNGLDDLKNKKIRVLHDLSFIDDPTRILRAIRFEKRYDFRIEPKTLRLLKAAVKNMMLERVQPQRIRDELALLLKENEPVKQLKRVQQLVGLAFIHPRLYLGRRGFALLQSACRQILWFKKACPGRRHLDTWLIYFMAALDSLTPAEIKQVNKKFVFRKGEEKRMLDYKNVRPAFIKRLEKKTLSPSRIFKLLNPLSYETLLLVKAKYNNVALQKHITAFLLVHHSVRLQLKGADLFQLGVTPGPTFREIFSKVFDAKLDGMVKTKEEEAAFAKKIARKK